MQDNSKVVSIHSLDLTPSPDRVYTNISRPWEEEVIYFLLIDRFHDGKERRVLASEGRTKGFGFKHQLKTVYGGNLRGVWKELDYIRNLGCTAIWLSPLLENNTDSYHGYAIQNFLKVDERFGTKEDLIQLIQSAHEKGMKVFLDCVINHSGNNWHYKGENSPPYDDGKQYEFGDWKAEKVLPRELQNIEYYQRKGHINNWDEYPESREGDFFSLKKFNHSETKEGLELQELLFKVYAYWIKETDCDGFRMDAVKHIGELPVARFATKIKEYAKLLGKEDFFIFSEVACSDNQLASFFKPSYSKLEEKTYEPSDSFLDFSSHFLLPKVVLGKVSPSKLMNRYRSLKEHLKQSSVKSFPLVTFLDNHDQIANEFKERIGALCNDKQLIAALGLLFTLPGVPCIYYGTEQGFRGFGEGDTSVREGMFSKEESISAHNQKSFLYKNIAELLRLRIEHGALVYGDLTNLSEEDDSEGMSVFFSRSYNNDRIFVAYNPLQDKSLIQEFPEEIQGKTLTFLYGQEEGSTYFVPKGKRKAGLLLMPLQFSIFKLD